MNSTERPYSRHSSRRSSLALIEFEAFEFLESLIVSIIIISIEYYVDVFAVATDALVVKLVYIIYIYIYI